MIRIVVDAELRARMGDFKQPVEFVDENGRLLAQARPVEREPLSPEITVEELNRREQSEVTWMTFEQVMARLKEPAER